MRNHKSRLVKPLRAWADTLRRPLFTRMRSHPASRTNEVSTRKTVTRYEVVGPSYGTRDPLRRQRIIYPTKCTSRRLCASGF